MDLVGRKLGQAGGANFQAFMSDISNFVEKNRSHPHFGAATQALGTASESVMQLAMGMLGWSQSESAALVPLAAERFLNMMSQTTLAWLLLDAAIIAETASARLAEGHPDKAFYEGKKMAALWFSRNVLPNVEATAKILISEDQTPMQMQDASFATI
jgi:hypothetical protein